MSYKLFGFFINIRESEKLEKGFKMWLIGI